MNAKYKARIVASGRMDEVIYGNDEARLARRAFKILTQMVPGELNVWPQKVVIYCRRGESWESLFAVSYRELNPNRKGEANEQSKAN